ncbi:MAG: hypothetical protein GX847_11595 [Clostridiales bacterium]|nr:hypothetical protein [Clostridiales bacterium]
MISIVLLLKIIGVIIVAAVWLGMYQSIRRRLWRLERCRERYDARLDALVRQVGQAEGESEPDAELKEARRKAAEAERRFTEGVASILNFSHTSAQPGDILTSGDSISHIAETGRKGE